MTGLQAYGGMAASVVLVAFGSALSTGIRPGPAPAG